MAQCASPYYSKQLGMLFPCGKCYECKQRRTSGWSFRLQKQAEMSESSLFVTLTYDNEHIPLTGENSNFMTLHKNDIQLFFKRLRKINGKSNNDKNPIRYYCAGEYGTKGKRPHYHIILFNSKFEDIQKAWKLGDIHVGKLTPASAAYTLKYISKPTMIGKYDWDPREPEFSLMSKGLGKNYITKNIKKWHKSDLGNHYYLPLLDGKKIALPRYYKEKLYTSIEQQKIAILMEMRILEENRKKSYKHGIAELDKANKIRTRNAEKNREKRNGNL